MERTKRNKFFFFFFEVWVGLLKMWWVRRRYKGWKIESDVCENRKGHAQKWRWEEGGIY